MSQSLNTHKLSTRPDVRRRQVDFTKALSVVKNIDELKRNDP